MANEFKFTPTKIAEAVDQKLVIKKLPEFMQNLEQIQMFFDDAIQPWFNPAEQELQDGYIGERSSPGAVGKIFLDEKDEQRTEYQLSPAYVSRNPDQSIRSLQFYPDLVGFMKSNGSLTDNESRLFGGKYYSWTPPINPNKIMNFSSYFWDLQNDFNISPDYIVMEQGALNGNTWSLQNFWYTIGQELPDGTILTESLAQSNRFTRALAPVIEYNKDIELMNYGTRFRGIVDYFSDIIKPEDIIQKRITDDVRIDGNLLKAGDRVLFTALGNPGENNRIYKIYVKTMEDNTKVYGVALDEDEEYVGRPTGEPLQGDVVLIRSGTQYKNTTWYWNGSRWTAAQKKVGINTAPKFKLYDRFGIALDDKSKYQASTFSGSELFGFKINYNFGTDAIYNKHIELSDMNYYVFENFIQTARYTSIRQSQEIEIPGLYYWNVITEDSTGTIKNKLATDWVRSTEDSKQYTRRTVSAEKTSMSKVFSTLYDMNNYENPIEMQYGYVMEIDTTYQYTKKSGATTFSWNVAQSEPVNADIFNATYKVQQKIDPVVDDIEVYVDGEVIYSTDYTQVLDSTGLLDSITINSTANFTEDTLITIRQYSKTAELNKDLGAYEIPVNLKNNPNNAKIEYVHAGLYTLHFQEVIRKNITKGAINDWNDYEARLKLGLVNNSISSQIIQNEASLLPLMLSSSNENLDIFSALLKNQSEYFRFKNRFNNVMIQIYNTDTVKFNAKPANVIVDEILAKLNVGKTSDFPFAINLVGSTASVVRTYIPATPQFLGILGTHRPQKAVYMHVGSSIGMYNVDHTGAVSKAYAVTTQNTRMDDVIFELETRIYNSIDNDFKDPEYIPVLNDFKLKPSAYFTGSEYTQQEYSTIALRGYTNFCATNAIDNTIHNYDKNNWMTWNFSGAYYNVNAVQTNIPARGSWRGIYQDMYGTYRPHTHPWEMFGFTQRPEWFNTTYKMVKVQIGAGAQDYIDVYDSSYVNAQGVTVSNKLWDFQTEKGDTTKGYIASGIRAGTYDEFKRFGTVPFKIVGTGVLASNGEEIKQVQLQSPVDLKMISGALTHLAEPWKFGDLGDVEFAYANTSLFAFDCAGTLLRAKPAQFCTYYFDTKNYNLKSVKNGVNQFQLNETAQRLSFSTESFVHSENAQRVLGYQMWVSDYLMSENKNVQKNYGDILRSSGVNIGHRIGAYTKAENLTFKSDSFGLVSRENQNIGLVRSSVHKQAVLSSVKITYTGEGYSVVGFDLVGGNFTVLKPNKTGQRNTVTENNISVVNYLNWLKQTETVQYNTLFKTAQEVYTFLCGYGKFLESEGWIFEDVSETGEVYNWTSIAKAFLNWVSASKTRGEYLITSPSSASAKFGSTFGSVQSVTQYTGGVWSLLDNTGAGIRPNEISTSRIGNVFNVRTEENSGKQIALIRLSLSSFEHAVVFDNKTIFGDNIYIPEFGSMHEMLKMFGYITARWNGRLEAPGFMVLESGTLPNFEKLVNDFTNYYNTDESTDSTDINNLSRHLIGFQSREYLREMITSDSAQVDFYRGFIKEKGSKQAFEKVLRVSKTYNTENYKALEEWAFKVGTYGNVNGKKHLQFNLISTDIKQQPQMFTFDENATAQSGTTSSVLYYGKEGADKRWITRPQNKFSFPERTGRSNRLNIPNVGPVTLNEVDIVAKSFDSANAARVAFEQTSTTKAKSAWILRDSNSEWNIYDINNTGITVQSITINPPVANEAETYCTITTDTAHNLNNGDWFFFTDESEFMPDVLKVEREYYISTSSANTFIIALNLDNDIIFSTTKPVLNVYKSRFNTAQDRTAYIDKKYQYNAVESTLFERPCTYNIDTNIPDKTFNVYDPINGVIPGSVMSEIKYISTINPAMYNAYESVSTAWGSEHVGEVWWDTTNAFFLDYTRAVYDASGNVDAEKTLEYKRTHWGNLLPESEIDVYEWVRSPVSPVEWDRYCAKQQKLNKEPNVWVPSGEAYDVDWAQFNEWDETTESYKAFYYFWVKNPTYLPKVHNRDKTANEITAALTNPLNLNQPWMAPISSDSFIICTPEILITDDTSVLSITYQDNVTEVVKHEQWQLCKEGMDYNFNPNIWNSLFNSLVCEEELSGGKINKLQYPETVLGSESNKTWFKNVLEARREFVSSANSIFKTLNITTNNLLMDTVFKVKTVKTNPKEVTFKAQRVNNEFVINVANKIFIENDAVLVRSNGTLPSPLRATDVYFTHITPDGYIKLMRSPSSAGVVVTIQLDDSGLGKHTIIKQSDYIAALGTDLDMTQYWDLTDWYSTGFSAKTEYTVETSVDAANRKNYQEGDCIRVSGSDNIWTLYTKTIVRGASLWQPVGRQNSTVELNEKLYTIPQQYDEKGEATSLEQNSRSVIKLLKDAFNSVQSRLVFDMVKYAHVESTVLDWVFKTSYIYVIGLEQPLQRNAMQQDDLISQIIQYFNEVKPYRTKIRSQIEQKTSDQDEVNGVCNDLGPQGYIFYNGAWVKSEKDIWDYEYAEYNEAEGKYDTVGSLPANFTAPQRPFQEMNTVLVFDNVKCKPDAELGTVVEMEAVDKQFSTQGKDNYATGEHYKIKRFTYTTPKVDTNAIGNELIYALYNSGIALNVSLGYPTAINTYITSLRDDVAGVEAFIKLVQDKTTELYSKSAEVNTVTQYSQYNTLANRLKLYTSKTDATIAYDVNCPFKGVVLNDNPNTKLPFGYSAELSPNSGYIIKSKEVYDYFYNEVLTKNPKFTETEVNETLVYDYGLYPWVADIATSGKFYSDTYLVLSAMLNNYPAPGADIYERAKDILQNPPIDSYAMVLLPRKYVKVKRMDNGKVESVPLHLGLDEYMESQLITNNVVFVCDEISLADLPVDDSVLYSEFRETIVNSVKNEYIDDMNSYDNLALESQYKSVVLKASGIVDPVQDPVFIDISEINPEGRDISQIKFTVDGYNFNSVANLAVKDYGNFQMEGFVTQNPYNAKEVLVSIARADEAQQYLDKANFKRDEIRYIHRIKYITNVNGVVVVPNHNLIVGDNVMISTGEDYFEMQADGTEVKIMSDANVRTGLRPKLFKVKSVKGDVITLDGLVFANTFDSTNKGDFIRNSTALALVRITNFTDAQFISGSTKKYSTARTYTVTCMDYDTFYDRTLGCMYKNPDYSVQYLSNEIVEVGGEVYDHGFYLPIYGQGALSELVRCKVTDSLQIFVYEYKAQTIKPVLTNGVWTYTGTVIDDVYIDAACGLTVMVKDLAKTFVSTPVGTVDLQLSADIIQNPSAVKDGNAYAANAEICTVRRNFMMRGTWNSPERYYNKATTTSVLAVDLGHKDSIDYYTEGFDAIPVKLFSTGMPAKTVIAALLQQK